MSALALLGWGGLLTALAMLLFLGAAPVFVVRLAARLYPPGSQQRRELPAEMAWAAQRDGFMRRWQWLGQTLATALCDGPAQRRRVRRVARQMHVRPLRPSLDITLEHGGVTFAGQVKLTTQSGSTSYVGTLRGPDGAMASWNVPAEMLPLEVEVVPPHATRRGADATRRAPRRS